MVGKGEMGRSRRRARIYLRGRCYCKTTNTIQETNPYVRIQLPDPAPETTFTPVVDEVTHRAREQEILAAL